MTVDELLNDYMNASKNKFEYSLNIYTRDYNADALKNGTKQTTFFKALEAVVRRCGDKYDYTDIINEHKNK